jgi:hypothetical protein
VLALKEWKIGPLAGWGIHNGVALVAFEWSGDMRSAVQTEVAARFELIEPQWILPLCKYTE